MADFDGLLRLVEAYYKFDSIAFDESVTGRALHRLLRVKSLGQVWVADSRGELTGYVILTYNYDLEFGGIEGLVTDMFVDQRFRRTGIGERLVAAVREYCRSRKISTIELQVTRHNRRAQAFYRALGFKELDRVVMSHEIVNPG